MLKPDSWTLWRDFNIDKGVGWNIMTADRRIHAWNENVSCRVVSQVVLSLIVVCETLLFQKAICFHSFPATTSNLAVSFSVFIVHFYNQSVFKLRWKPYKELSRRTRWVFEGHIMTLKRGCEHTVCVSGCSGPILDVECCSRLRKPGPSRWILIFLGRVVRSRDSA